MQIETARYNHSTAMKLKCAACRKEFSISGWKYFESIRNPLCENCRKELLTKLIESVSRGGQKSGPDIVIRVVTVIAVIALIILVVIGVFR